MILQLDYEREGIQWEKTDFTDNLAIVRLLDGNPGVFGLLNEVRIKTLFWVKTNDAGGTLPITYGQVVSGV